MDYLLKRSHRKTLALEVTRDMQVIVRAPWQVSQRQIDDFMADRADWLARALAKQVQALERHPEPTESELSCLLEQARQVIPPRVAYYAALMGLVPTAVKVNKARGRFGSCSAHNRLNFSCRLLRYPMAAIDYVVVHELAHIVHKNHGPAFYALVESILPNYRERRGLLR